MCGIIGIINSDNLAADLYNALFTIQHRGQDSAGILTFDGSEIHLKKGLGLVGQAFSDEDVRGLKGRVGIGHVRYPTIGSDNRKDCQPFFVNYPYGIGMAHNGNLVNYEGLRRELIRKHNRMLTSKCDIELTLNLFATELINNGKIKGSERIFAALASLMKRLNGSYSVVSVIASEGLLAFRDPNGIKPLVFGKRKEPSGATSYAFCSESVALDILGYKVVKDVAPGEAILVTHDLKVKSRVIRREKPAPCMFEWVYFARPDSVIEKKSVYGVRLALGTELARTWKKRGLKADIVIPVPDTSRTAALAFSAESGIAPREGLIKNRYSQRTFIMGTQSGREKAVKMKLNPIILELKGRRVAIIDDSLVRGTTSKKIVKLVRDAGAKEVHFLLTCPPIKYPCFYGIDMPTRAELIASAKSPDEIARAIGADSVVYQTLQGLKKAIGLRVCTACLDGRYPTRVTEDDVRGIEEARETERKIVDFTTNGIR
jgi:amidophosphoribosyltransferase